MIIKNWIVGFFIIFWTIYGILYSVSPIIWFTIFWAVVLVWLVLTILGWKTASDNRGDSWDEVIRALLRW